jgi:hypothetical protein
MDIRAIHVQQSFFQRLMGTGTIRLSTASSDDYEIEISGVAKPDEVANLLRGLQENRNVPEQAIGSSSAPVGSVYATFPIPASQIQQIAPSAVQPATARVVGQESGGILRAVASGVSADNEVMGQSGSLPGGPA